MALNIRFQDLRHLPKTGVNDRIGNSGYGDKPQRPNIPMQVQKHKYPNEHDKPFDVRKYNNNVESYRSAEIDTKYWKKQYHTNNFIGHTRVAGGRVGGSFGNAGNGDNKSVAGYRPRSYLYNVQVLGNRSGCSQTKPYDANTIMPAGVMVPGRGILDANVNMGEDEVFASGVPHRMMHSNVPRPTGNLQTK